MSKLSNASWFDGSTCGSRGSIIETASDSSTSSGTEYALSDLNISPKRPSAVRPTFAAMSRPRCIAEWRVAVAVAPDNTSAAIAALPPVNGHTATAPAPTAAVRTLRRDMPAVEEAGAGAGGVVGKTDSVGERSTCLHRLGHGG